MDACEREEDKYQGIEYVQKKKEGKGIRVTADSAYFPRYENAEDIPDWESFPSLHEHLITPGEQGWQYAGNVPAVHGGFSCVLFRLA